jgi:hypothetical protein
MARIVELVLILNGLGGIATYLGIKAHRLRSAARRVVGGDDDDMSLSEATQVYAPPPEKPPKRSFLAKIGHKIR